MEEEEKKKEGREREGMEGKKKKESGEIRIHENLFPSRQLVNALPPLNQSAVTPNFVHVLKKRLQKYCFTIHYPLSRPPNTFLPSLALSCHALATHVRHPRSTTHARPGHPHTRTISRTTYAERHAPNDMRRTIYIERLVFTPNNIRRTI